MKLTGAGDMMLYDNYGKVLTGLITIFILGVVGPAPVYGQSPLQPDVHLRAGYYGTWGDQRDGSFREEHMLQGRLRAGITWTPSPSWSIAVREAMKFSSDQDHWHVRGLGYHAGSDGFIPGDIGVDLLRVRFSPSPNWGAEAGRLQLGFGLPDLMGRSFHRNDGTNIAVQWVDGFHVQRSFPGTGTAHLAVMYNPETPTTAFRSPLQFSAAESRVGMFAALQGTQAVGPLDHQALHVSFLPAATPTVDGDERAYVAVSAQAMTSVPVGETAHVAVGTEIGWSPTPLAPELLGLDPGVSVSPFNGQLTVNLLGVGHGAHSFAVASALISPRWLISPDYRPNSRDIEARYYWRFHPDLRLDMRVRRRQDRWVPASAARGRVDYDTYVRLNVYLR